MADEVWKKIYPLVMGGGHTNLAPRFFCISCGFMVVIVFFFLSYLFHFICLGGGRDTLRTDTTTNTYDAPFLVVLWFLFYSNFIWFWSYLILLFWGGASYGRTPLLTRSRSCRVLKYCMKDNLKNWDNLKNEDKLKRGPQKGKNEDVILKTLPGWYDQSCQIVLVVAKQRFQF